MRLSRRTLLVCSFSAAVIPNFSHAQNASLTQCRSLQKRIDKLNHKRRRGGNAKQMEGWKQQRRDTKERFKELRCKKWGYKL